MTDEIPTGYWYPAPNKLDAIEPATVHDGSLCCQCGHGECVLIGAETATATEKDSMVYLYYQCDYCFDLIVVAMVLAAPYPEP